MTVTPSFGLAGWFRLECVSDAVREHDKLLIEYLNTRDSWRKRASAREWTLIGRVSPNTERRPEQKVAYC